MAENAEDNQYSRFSEDAGGRLAYASPCLMTFGALNSLVGGAHGGNADVGNITSG